MSELTVAKELAEYALDTPMGRAASEKLLDLGRRLLQGVHRHNLTSADLFKAVDAIHPDELSDAAKIASTAAERIKSWYPKLSPELGTFLTDPNVVLTLGDARGQTEFFAKSSAAEIARLNKMSSAEGIQFHIRSTEPLAISSPNESSEIHLDLTSRRGLEKVTAASQFFNLPKFSAAGTQTPHQWLERAESVQELMPNLKLTDHEFSYVAFGVMKGYPDKAILAMKLTERELWKGTQIKCANYYNCAQPNFIYNPLDAEGVSRVSNVWGEALSQFYKSREHREIRGQVPFVRERLKDIDTTMKNIIERNAPIEPESAESDNSYHRSFAEMEAWRKSFNQLR